MSVRLIFHNVDRLDPAEICASPMSAHYFADTRMTVRHLTFALGFSRVSVGIVQRSNADTPLMEQFVFDFAETPRDQLEREFAHIFGRYPRAIECYRSMRAMPWPKQSEHGLDAFRAMRGGVLIMRGYKEWAKVYNPFARLPALATMPVFWSVDELVRALHNGQVAAVRCTGAGRLTATIRTLSAPESAEYSAGALARKLVEDVTMGWKIGHAADGCSLVVTGSRVDSFPGGELVEQFEVTPEIL